jgi:hypothetical protein
MTLVKPSLAAIGLLASINFSSSSHAVSVLPQDATTGADGVFNLSTSLDLTIPADGIFNFTDFSIDSGGYLGISSDSPVFLYANDFQINGSIYATVPELYLIGSNISFGANASFTSTIGLAGLYADNINLGGHFVVQDMTVAINANGIPLTSDTTASQPVGAVVFYNGTLDQQYTVPVANVDDISATSEPGLAVVNSNNGGIQLNAGDLQVISGPSAGGDVVLEPGNLQLVPLPGAAVLFLSGLLGLFSRHWIRFIK